MDLNIVERNVQGQAWKSAGQLTAGDLSKVVEQVTDSNSALNALPTPFARFFVVDEAFRRVYDQFISPDNEQKRAGKAYERLVSDTLDVFELLYNLEYHRQQWDKTTDISIIEWDVASQMAQLQKSVPKLHNSLNVYINDDLRGLKTLFFVVLKHGGRDYLLATSSPYTGFVTPPDLDKKDIPKTGATAYIGGAQSRYQHMPKISRKSTGKYFDDILALDKRDPDFKNYMLRLVNGDLTPSSLDNLQRLIKGMLQNDPDVNFNWQSNSQPVVTDQNNDVDICGLKLSSDKSESTINFFNDKIVKIPYRLSAESFTGMVFVNDNSKRDYDFLIPLRPETLPMLDEDFVCQGKVSATGDIEVTITNAGQKYVKSYSEQPHGQKGQIVDLKKHCIDVDIAFCPNILSAEDAENDYFEVAMVMDDGTDNAPKVGVGNVSLDFYDKRDGRYQAIHVVEANNRAATYGVKPRVIRSERTPDGKITAGSQYYEIFDTVFRAVNVQFALSGGLECQGILFPKWQQSQRTPARFTYAVDLGTTNTFVSVTRNDSGVSPEQITIKKPMVAYSHHYDAGAQFQLTDQIEKGIFENGRSLLRTEFSPAVIDNKPYSFPTRTAICQAQGAGNDLSLFANANIAFFYEKAMRQANQEIRTDIKWNSDNESQLELFIRQLMLTVKAHVLQNNGTLNATHIVWFRPLSFSGSSKSAFERIWREQTSSMLKIGNDAVECVSESEAPYYYFKQTNEFKSVDAVAVVDIGGGSSDFVYFADNKPQMANSVHFGCDVIWGNGFSEFANARQNGIYKKYADALHFAKDEALEAVNADINNSSSSTKDIISFWLSHDRDLHLSEKISKDFRHVLLYHFGAIVYFMASMLKAKGHPVPKSVLFCGNGSRYVDTLLTTDHKVVEKLVQKTFEHVYGQKQAAIQIILPQGRKECTCYGGLFRPDNAQMPDEFNYQGTDTEYQDVEHIKKAYDASIRPALLKKVNDYNELYKALVGIINRDDQMNDVNFDKVYKAISENLEDKLDKNYKNQVVQKLSPQTVYHDSLFFMPVIENILALTNL